MGTPIFQVCLTESALRDLNEIDDYWTLCGEPERGEKYVRDLAHAAHQYLTIPSEALAGKKLKSALLPGTREVRVFKASYRIVYRVIPDEGLVYVLRFWHSHRAEPDSL